MLYILKPVASSCGRGIKVISKNTKVLKQDGYLASKYVANPHLINGYKYDLRVYVLAASYDPLRIYVYNDGLVRFATEKYNVDNKDLKKKFIHLTNFSVNKKSEKFKDNKGTGRKRRPLPSGASRPSARHMRRLGSTSTLCSLRSRTSL